MSDLIKANAEVGQICLVSEHSNHSVFRVKEVGAKIHLEQLSKDGWVEYGQISLSAFNALDVFEPVKKENL